MQNDEMRESIQRSIADYDAFFIAMSESEKLNLPVDEMQISTRPFNCLKNSGLATIGDVVRAGYAGLRPIPNMGAKSIAEVDDFLVWLGFPSMLLPKAKVERPLPTKRQIYEAHPAMLAALKMLLSTEDVVFGADPRWTERFYASLKMARAAVAKIERQ